MPNLTLKARAANTITVTIAALGGETAWELEANRAADFYSDESLTINANAAGDVVFPDLVPDTPYYFRARKTNGGVGSWSATLMGATLVPTQAQVPYTGFSIEPAILVVPEPLVLQGSGGIAAGSLGTDLFNDDPMATVKFTSTVGSYLEIRTPGRSLDVISVLGAQANENVTWRVRAANSLANVTAAPLVDTGLVSFRINPGIGRRAHYHAYRRLAAPVTHEWWRIDFAGFTQSFFARHVVMGLARASVNLSRGAGHNANDMGQMQRTVFGSPDRVRGWRGRRVEFPLSWLREAEYEAKWRDLDHLVGTTDPVLALPNPKLNAYLNDRIAYGHISQARSEMMRGDRYLRQLEIDSLY